MYAVIKTGGKQYRVSPGDLMVVEKLAGEPGASVAFGEVLMVGEGDAVVVGAPTVAGAKVSATLVETRKGEKVKIFKKIRRQGYRRTRGHRQTETVLRVTAIAGADGKETKWDGKVDLTTKGELDARARGLTFVSPEAQREAAAAAKVQKVSAPKPATAKAAAKAPAKARKIETADEVVADPEVIAAMNTAETNAPVKAEAKAAPAKKAAAKPAAKAEATPKKAPAKADAGEKKAAAPKKAATAPKASATKDKPAK